MSAITILQWLKQKGMMPKVQQDKLRVEDPDRELTKADLAMIGRHKQELIRLLSQRAQPVGTPNFTRITPRAIQRFKAKGSPRSYLR